MTDSVHPKTMGLYVHIPFCLAKCAYCDFFFFFFDSACNPDEDFVSALISEISDCKKRFAVSSWSSVYIGGGTPSLLKPACIKRLLSFIHSEGLCEHAEITVEANPETLTEPFLRALDECGVTRLSLGIQSMNDHALAAVNRHCTASANRTALHLVQSKWQHDISVDCIAGLPGQDDSQFCTSLSEMLSYEPDHVSLYTLTVEEDTPLYTAVENGTAAFSQETADRQWLLGKDLLNAAGYRQYEVSNFSKPGHESKHNFLYWTQSDYAGAGSGACGTVYDWDTAQAVRFTACQDRALWKQFWLSGKSDGEQIPAAVRECEVLDAQTLEFEFLMMGLRTVRGVSESAYRKRFSCVEPWKGNLELRLNQSAWWKKLAEEKKASVTVSGNDRIFALNPDGLLLLNPLLRSL